MIRYACETCHTIGDTPHDGHLVLGIEGDSLDEIDRVAVKHLVLARRIRSGQIA